MGDPLLLDLVPRRVMPCGALLGTIQVAQPQDGATEDPLRGTGQSGGRAVRGIDGSMPSAASEPVVAVRDQRLGTTSTRSVIVTAHIDAPYHRAAAERCEYSSQRATSAAARASPRAPSLLRPSGYALLS